MPWLYPRNVTEDNGTCSEDYLSALVENDEVPFDPDIAGLGVLLGFLITSTLALIATIVAYTTFSIPTKLLNESDEVSLRLFRTPFVDLWKKLCLPDVSRTRTTDHRDDRVNTFTTFMLSVSGQILVSQLAILIATFAGHQEITIYSLDVIIAMACLASTVHLATFPLLVKDLKDHLLAKNIRVFFMCSATVMLVCLLSSQLSEDWSSTDTVYFQCVRWKLKLTLEEVPDFLLSLLVPFTVAYGTIQVVLLLYGFKYKDSNPDGKQAKPQDIQRPQSATMETRSSNEVENRLDEETGKSKQQSGPTNLREQDMTLTGRRNVPRRNRDGSSQRETIDDQDEKAQGPKQPESNQPIPEDEPFTLRRRATFLHGDSTVGENEQGFELREMDLEQGNSPMSIEQRNALNPRRGQHDTLERQRQTPPSPKESSSNTSRSSESEHRSEKSIALGLWLQNQASRAIRSQTTINGQRIVAFRLAEAWAFHECQSSFIWRILWLWSGNVYGVTGVFVARENDSGMQGDRNKFGFGQIVPLALLILPIFAAIQTRIEYVKATSNYKANVPIAELQELAPARHQDELNDPDILNWSQGKKPTDSPRVKAFIRLHAAFMFVFLTFMGVFTAKSGPTELMSFLFIMATLITIREVYFSVWLKFKYRKSKRGTQEGRQDNPPDQAQNTMMAEGAGSMNPQNDE